jgi:putative component of toxin-antitoxin plasmid stabilization module
MSNFFLLNEAIEINSFDSFLNGIDNLNSIKKDDSHNFKKHSSVYNLINYSKLFESYGQLEQLAVIFLEQLSNCEKYIDTEVAAHGYCGTNKNGFLGIDFSKTNIIKIKQITDNDNYDNWIYHHLNNIEKLKRIIPNYNFYSSFEKEFTDLNVSIQDSIIDEFIKAKQRNLSTPFSPDTKIIKDVTQPNFKNKIMELRIYTPVAIRVYFNELGNKVNLISIEQKSNPNQDEDIKKAYAKYKKM